MTRFGVAQRLRMARNGWKRFKRVDHWEVHACYGYEDNDRDKAPTKTFRLMLERQPLWDYLYHAAYNFLIGWVLRTNSYKVDIKAYQLSRKNVTVLQDIDLGDDSRLWDSYW